MTNIVESSNDAVEYRYTWMAVGTQDEMSDEYHTKKGRIAVYNKKNE